MWCSAGWESVRRKRFICHIYCPLPSERKASCRRTRILKLNLFRSHRPVKPDWQRGYSRNQNHAAEWNTIASWAEGQRPLGLFARSLHVMPSGMIHVWLGPLKLPSLSWGPIMLLSFSSNWRAAEIAIIIYKTKEWKKNGWSEQHSERWWDGSGEFDEWISPSYW